MVAVTVISLDPGFNVNGVPVEAKARLVTDRTTVVMLSAPTT